MRCLRIFVLGLAVAGGCTYVEENPNGALVRQGPDAVARLGGYNADIQQTSVSGISAGGYMAVQFHVAFSGIMRGAGILAGGPYHCAGSSGQLTEALTTCTNASPHAPDAPSLIRVTDERAASGVIDATTNLAGQRVWLFSGTQDTTVRRPVMDALQQYYQHYISADQVAYKNDLNAAHAHITDSYGNPCTTSMDPYINNCGYDAAGVLLQQIYGTLSPRNTGTLSGQLIQFDQSEFLPSPGKKGMDATGWVYVPDACAKGQPCRVHVAFHGCEQYQGKIGDKYYTHGGYNQWADTNNIIILYPQTVASYTGPSNPKGCWDWWGYNGGDTYDLKTGDQMAAIRSMIDRLTSGAAGPPPPPAPPPPAPAPAPPPSPPPAPAPPPPPPATCYTDNNWNHYKAGRATNCTGHACALGSGQDMGLLNTYYVTTLKQTAPGYYVIGTCP